MTSEFILKCIGLPVEVCKNINDISQSFGVVLEEKEVIELIKTEVNDGFSYLGNEIIRTLYIKVINKAMKKFHLKDNFGFYILRGVSQIQYKGIAFKNFDELKKLI